MMFIHGLVSGILPILMTILVAIMTIHAQPFKTPIDIDLSSPPPKRVRIVPSKVYPGGINYAIKPHSFGTYILGAIRDGEEIIMDGDPTEMSRYIFVVTREDGLRYVRIITRWNRDGYGHSAHVREFLKLTGSPYRELNRDPTDVDLLSQEDDQFINVTKTVSGSREGQEGTIHYSIKSQFWITNTIGVVRYGHYIINDKVDRLLEREVTWYGRLERPIIIITSKYNSGREAVEKYVIVDGKLKVVDCRNRPFSVWG